MARRQKTVGEACFSCGPRIATGIVCPSAEMKAFQHTTVRKGLNRHTLDDDVAVIVVVVVPVIAEEVKVMGIIHSSRVGMDIRRYKHALVK